MKKNIINHLSSKEWDCTYSNGWVGKPLVVPNLSGGYHGLLKQWFDHYKRKNFKCLLISENNLVKEKFQTIYPDIEFKTTEFYDEMNDNVDLKLNLCDAWDNSALEKFDIIVCQATFEHLYDPCTAIKNLSNISNINGIILIHTHVPGMFYHPFPKDYIRFHPDWFFDVKIFAKDLELVELIEAGVHIFAAYKKIGNKNV